MTELFTGPRSAEEEKKQKLARYISLAEEVSNRKEGFSFPGIEDESHKSLKQSDEEYPGFTTPVDEIIKRMELEGIKIVLGKHKDSGNIYVLPLLSNSIENDSLFPRHLRIAEDMDKTLKELILLNKEMFLRL